MHRTTGILLLLAGSILLLLAGVLLWRASIESRGYAVGTLLLASAVLVVAVATLRSAGRRLGLTRPALAGAVAAAVVVVLSAIVIPTVVVNRDRTRRLRTMSDLRNIATALEERARAVQSYPDVKTIQELEPLLTPAHMKELPQRDHWGHALRYERLPDGYAIASAGRDGIWERPHLRDYKQRATTDDDADIVFANGGFLQYLAPPPGPY